MDMIQSLEYKTKINKYLKKHDFSEWFKNEDILQFYEFLESKIGKIWLTKQIGIHYKNWQKE